MSIDFEWTPVRRKFLEACLDRKLEPVFIATAISNVLRIPCDAGIVEEEAFRIALDVIDGLKTVEKPVSFKDTHLASKTVTPDSGTDRPSLGKLDGVYANEKAMEAVSVPEVVETPPPAPLTNKRPIKKKNKIIKSLEQAVAEPWTIKIHTPKDMEAISERINSGKTCICGYAPCGKEFTQPSKGKKQIYCSLRCNKAATKARAKVKAEAEKASATREVGANAVPVSELAKPQPEATFAFVWTDEIVNEMIRFKENNYSNGGISSALNEKFGTALTPDQVAEKGFLEMERTKDAWLSAGAIIAEEAVPIEPLPLDAPLKLSEPVASFAPLESRDAAVPPMPKPSQIPPRLIGKVVLPIQGDPPPGRSAYDRMLRGEK